MKFDSFGDSVCLFSEDCNQNFLHIIPTSNENLYNSKIGF